MFGRERASSRFPSAPEDPSGAGRIWASPWRASTMSDKPAVCVRIADDLLAAAIGEASPGAAERVERHVAICRSCRREFQGYRSMDETVATLRDEALPSGQVALARERLETRLADL